MRSPSARPPSSGPSAPNRWGSHRSFVSGNDRAVPIVFMECKPTMSEVYLGSRRSRCLASTFAKTNPLSSQTGGRREACLFVWHISPAPVPRQNLQRCNPTPDRDASHTWPRAGAHSNQHADYRTPDLMQTSCTSFGVEPTHTRPDRTSLMSRDAPLPPTSGHGPATGHTAPRHRQPKRSSRQFYGYGG